MFEGSLSKESILRHSDRVCTGRAKGFDDSTTYSTVSVTTGSAKVTHKGIFLEKIMVATILDTLWFSASTPFYGKRNKCLQKARHNAFQNATSLAIEQNIKSPRVTLRTQRIVKCDETNTSTYYVLIEGYVTGWINKPPLRYTQSRC